jgi:hypothetical protein
MRGTAVKPLVDRVGCGESFVVALSSMDCVDRRARRFLCDESSPWVDELTGAQVKEGRVTSLLAAYTINNNV